MMKRIVAVALSTAFLAAVSVAPAAAQATQTQTTTTAKPVKKPAAKRAASPGQLAARERQKKCGAEWKEAKAGGKIEKGMKWPQYWSACNKRLKGAGA
jgi:hypothetical protein